MLIKHPAFISHPILFIEPSSRDTVQHVLSDHGLSDTRVNRHCNLGPFYISIMHFTTVYPTTRVNRHFLSVPRDVG